jgi:hypothetical protein
MHWPVRKLSGDSARILQMKQSNELSILEGCFSVCEKEGEVDAHE